MAQNDGDTVVDLEGLDLEDLSEEQRNAVLLALKEGKETVDIPGVAQSDTPPVPPKTDEPPKVEPSVPEEPKEGTPAPADVKPKPSRPANYHEALDLVNTLRQKLESRERLIARFGSSSEFAKTYLQERGISIQIGQDPVAMAKAVEQTEYLAASQAESQQQRIQQARNAAFEHADEILSGYDTGLQGSFSVEHGKWEAVWAALGQDPVKAEKYVKDPEFRKTISVEGPSNIEAFMKVLSATSQWFNDTDRKPLNKYLGFHDIAQKAQAQTPVAPAPKQDDSAFREAQRLAAKQDEPRTMPNSSAQPQGGSFAGDIEALLVRAEDIGTDNLTPEERMAIRKYYAQ